MKKTKTDSKLSKSLFNQGMKYYKLAQEFPYYSLDLRSTYLFHDSLLKDPSNKKCFLKYMDLISYNINGITDYPINFAYKLWKRHQSSLKSNENSHISRIFKNLSAPDPMLEIKELDLKSLNKYKDKYKDNTAIDHFFLGYCYDACFNPDIYGNDIEREFLKSIELDKDYMTPYIYLIRHYFKTGKIKEGRDLFIKAYKNFKNIDFLFRVAARDELVDDTEGCIQHIKDISEKILLEYVSSVKTPPEDIYSTFKLSMAYSDLFNMANSPEGKKYYYLKFFEYHCRYIDKSGDFSVLSYLNENFIDKYISLDIGYRPSIMLDPDNSAIKEMKKLLSVNDWLLKCMPFLKTSSMDGAEKIKYIKNALNNIKDYEYYIFFSILDPSNESELEFAESVLDSIYKEKQAPRKFVLQNTPPYSLSSYFCIYLCWIKLGNIEKAKTSKIKAIKYENFRISKEMDPVETFYEIARADLFNIKRENFKIAKTLYNEWEREDYYHNFNYSSTCYTSNPPFNSDERKLFDIYSFYKINCIEQAELLIPELLINDIKGLVLNIDHNYEFIHFYLEKYLNLNDYEFYKSYRSAYKAAFATIDCVDSNKLPEINAAKSIITLLAGINCVYEDNEEHAQIGFNPARKAFAFSDAKDIQSKNKESKSFRGYLRKFIEETGPIMFKTMFVYAFIKHIHDSAIKELKERGQVNKEYFLKFSKTIEMYHNSKAIFDIRSAAKEYENKLETERKFADERIRHKEELSKVKIQERDLVIADLSHHIKNLVKSVIDPLKLCLEKEKNPSIENAIRGADLIRQMVNAMNLTSKGSFADFIHDANENKGVDAVKLYSVILESLKCSIGNMFDSKYFNVFMLKYMPTRDFFNNVKTDWAKVSGSNKIEDILEFCRKHFFDIELKADSSIDLMIGNSRGSAIKIMILFQEAILNAVKYAAFVPEDKRKIVISIDSDSQSFRFEVRNSYLPEQNVKGSGLGHIIIGNFCKLLDSEPVIVKTDNEFALQIKFKNIWSQHENPVH